MDAFFFRFEVCRKSTVVVKKKLRSQQTWYEKKNAHLFLKKKSKKLFYLDSTIFRVKAYKAHGLLNNKKKTRMTVKYKLTTF